MAIILRLLKICAALLLVFWGGGLLLFRFIDPPATPLMVIRSVERGAWIAYRPVRLEEIAAGLPRAVIASEDGRFCLHRGIDLGAVQEALEDYEETGRLRGASTITMQVARNLFLWPGGGFARKAIEVPLALALDALWPKRRIMEVYLNIAEMGAGLFGAATTAQAYFNRVPGRLTESQAARLAAILPAPTRWNAATPTAYVERRTGTIMARMAQLGPAQVGCLQ
ncbi:monofunctional biosynthetic peptidoglycan transglycosylase [Ferrovibrio sp.]|jgi:monofunctional biosynthetic peptidoglycan transglycosylase|uniref:monofunctional biosynthetic peptidoglycan transglycosylase n=1 Tax=Ferrovibrio sp. TaxID=1917215 RepID=UPI0035B1BB5D